MVRAVGEIPCDRIFSECRQKGQEWEDGLERLITAFKWVTGGWEGEKAQSIAYPLSASTGFYSVQSASASTLPRWLQLPGVGPLEL